MNEAFLTALKKIDFKKPDFHKKDKIFDKVIRNCHNNCFHKFEYRCI